jgi:CRISPR-associated protein Csh1
MENNKLIEDLRIKINNDITQPINSDDEYYFAVGQAISYLLSRDMNKKKSHARINPVLNSKTNEELKKEVIKLYKKYNWRVYLNNKRFNNMFAMVMIYKPNSKINNNLIMIGYLNHNLIYEKEIEKI